MCSSAKRRSRESNRRVQHVCCPTRIHYGLGESLRCMEWWSLWHLWSEGFVLSVLKSHQSRLWISLFSMWSKCCLYEGLYSKSNEQWINWYLSWFVQYDGHSRWMVMVWLWSKYCHRCFWWILVWVHFLLYVKTNVWNARLLEVTRFYLFI